MTSIASTGPANALLGAIDYARQGIERGLDGYAAAAQSIAEATGSGDLPPVEALVGLGEARLQVAAAAKVLERIDRGLGTLLDVRA
jgi:hypothetical protein